MKNKRSIILLGFVILVTTVIVAVIDATMIVRHDIVPEPEEKISLGLLYLLTEGPWWWIVVPILLGLITGVGVIAFLLGSRSELSSRDAWGLVLVSLIPTIFLISGLFDLISATCIQSLKGRNPLFWVNYSEWWWTTYHPFPRLSFMLAGRSYPTWEDIVAGSIAGVIVIAFSWIYWGIDNFASQFLSRIKRTFSFFHTSERDKNKMRT